MWTSGYLFDLSKTKNIYTFVVQEKYLNKNDFLLPWKIAIYFELADLLGKATDW